MSKRLTLLFAILFLFFPSFAQSPKTIQLSDAAIALTNQKVTYVPAYVKLTYPNGDVPANTGVCTDVVIRAYRNAFKIDLQKEVHEDMKSNFSLYPKNWGQKGTDRNIDHRRVYNLMVFFKRKGVEKTISKKAEDYKPGDLVCWILPKNLAHIGIVTNQKSADGKRYLIVHNVGAGQVLEDILFAWKIIGHYQYKL